MTKPQSPTVARQVVWLEHLDEVAAFVAAHGRLPRNFGKDLADGEQKPGRWLSSQRRMLAGQTLSTERRGLLDESIPTWADGRAREQAAAWMKHADDVAAFMAEHGRLPLRRADRGDGEVALGPWLGLVRASAGKGELAVDRRDYLDAHVPGWDAAFDRAHYNRTRSAGSRARNFAASVDLLATFVADAGRLPRGRAPLLDERSRFNFLTKQRAAAAEGLLQPNRRGLLDAHVPTWAGRSRAAGAVPHI